MDNLLNFPPSTEVNRSVPKTAFYRNMEMNTRLRQRFVEDVERILWLYKLAPSTLNIADGKAVHEITIFHVQLKVQEASDELFAAIDRQMPRHVLFILQCKDKFCLLMNYKEWTDQAKGTFNILKAFRTEWLTQNELKLDLTGTTLDYIYESFAGQISGFGTANVEDTKQMLALHDEIARKRKVAESLQKRVRNERQFARQMELNSEARLLKQEIAKLEKKLQILRNK